MSSNRIGRRVAVMASALALTLGSSVVLAQPGPGAGFGPGAGRGPGGHGGPGGDFVQVMVQLKSQLNLNTSQQTMWDNAAALSKSARDSMRAQAQQVQDQIKAELAKAEPDLAAIATAMDSVRAQGLAQRKPARDAWLALYATFTPQQKAIVRDALLARMQRHEQMRQRFQQRFGNQAPAQ